MIQANAAISHPKSSWMSFEPIYKFRLLHVGYWVFVSLMSFLSLTLWYGPFEWIHIQHILLQAVMGGVLSLALYYGFMRLWSRPILVRAGIGLGMVFGVSLIWTVARIEVFIRLTQISTEWSEFGGWHFASMFIFLCWTGLFHGIRYYDLLQQEHAIMLQAEADAREEQVKRVQAQSIARDAQLKMLRYQLTPHFLCNTLNAINSLIELEDLEKAQEMNVQLSQFLRHSLENNPDTKITLKSEVAALNLYLAIEKTRFGERLNLDFQISDAAQLGMVPSLLLQPIIENSMKHAIAQSESGGSISIHADVVNKQLALSISDTGSGDKIAVSKLESSNGRGIGVKNTNERLKALYDQNFNVSIELLDAGGLKTTITIPYETDDC